MMILEGTSALLKLVTSAAAAVDTHVSYADHTESTDNITTDSQHQLITTAATTTILASPASGVKRNAKLVNVRNSHASTANTVTVKLTDGTTEVELFKATLAAGETLVLNDTGTWFVYDSVGGVKMGGSIASDTAAGLIQIATQAEQETGTDVLKAVTPGRQHFHASSNKFWVKGGLTGNILASYNVTSLTDTGTGAITVTIANDFSSAHWSCVATIELTSTTVAQSCTYDSMAAGSVLCRSVVEAGSAADPVTWSIQGAGDL